MKPVLITGGSSGIGLGCAKKLCGDHTVILCSRNLPALKAIQAALHDRNIIVSETDVTDRDQVNALFDRMRANNTEPEVVINSAGIALGMDPLEEGKIEEWERMLDTNVKGLLMVSRRALKAMKEKNRGHIINIGSIAGIDPYPNGIVYAATKAAVKAISDGLRRETVSHKIRVTNIQPGMTETNFSVVRFGGDKKRAKAVYEGIKPLSGDDVGDIVRRVIAAPEHVHVHEVTVTPLHQATVETVRRHAI